MGEAQIERARVSRGITVGSQDYRSIVDGARDRVSVLPQFGAHLGVDDGAARWVVHYDVSRPFAGYIRRHQRRGEAGQKPEFFNGNLHAIDNTFDSLSRPETG